RGRVRDTSRAQRIYQLDVELSFVSMQHRDPVAAPVENAPGTLGRLVLQFEHRLVDVGVSWVWPVDMREQPMGGEDRQAWIIEADEHPEDVRALGGAGLLVVSERRLVAMM